MKETPNPPAKQRIALALTLACSCVSAPGALTYSGVVNIPIPTTFEGVYLNLDSGDSSTGDSSSGTADANSFTVGAMPVSGWDVNFFFGGIGMAHAASFQPFRDDASDNLSRMLWVAEGTLVDAASVAANTLTLGGFGGSGQANGSAVGESHFGVGPDFFTSGSLGFIAFVLNPDTTPQYGWMKVTLDSGGGPGVIHEWAYSSDSIVVGEVIPEPSVLWLCGGALAGLLTFGRNRKSC